MTVSQRKHRYQNLLLAYLRPQWRQVALLAGLLLTGIGLELVNPLIMRRFIDTAVAGGALETLTTIALLFLGVALVGQVASVAETYVAENVGLTATNQLRADLMRHCLRLDPGFHSAHTPGELIERVDGDVATLANYFSRFTVQLVGNGLLLAGILVLLFGIDWRVGATLTVLAVGGLALINRLRGLAVPRWTLARQASAEVFGFLEERLAGTEDIRANGANAYMLRGLAARSRDLLRKERMAGLVGLTAGSTSIILLALGTVVALGLGAYLFQAGTVTIGTLVLIFTYTQMLTRPIEQISRQMQDLQRAAASVGRISDLLAMRSVIDDGGAAPLPAGPLAVEFDRVTFSYSEDEPVLRDLTFALAPGQVLGLLGRTGSGKTTIIRLLFRLYDPAAGAIRLGGVDLRQTPLAELRRRVGVVTQEIQLFHASVRDNLTFFNRTIADERILAVLWELGLEDWYRTLPEGLETRLAPGGSGLSAGEAQLLAFARVFLHDPGLVILDEASSRLDPATERRLERAVDRLLTGRTGIIIAHRLATVERADLILVLEDGVPIELGPRVALAADPDSRYARLRQLGLEEVLA